MRRECVLKILQAPQPTKGKEENFVVTNHIAAVALVGAFHPY
jgi:hypothetical protein